MYEDVERMGNIFAAFATLAIIVACLGLFALSSFMVEQRRKEIGIRLVMGATVNNIFHLLTGNFLKLVLISFAIATPIAWYMMRTWLEDYKYKIPLSWDLFVVAGMLSLIIAMATISYQTLAAAFVSPAKSLRSE
jgi:putative ABC transport system permease protein